MHMYLERLFRNSLPQAMPRLISWFRASQNGDGGFGFFHGTTSFVENCHYCLQALTVLGAEPVDPEKARRFITACRTASGGFGRGIRAAPFLDATWHAVASLVLLNPGMGLRLCLTIPSFSHSCFHVSRPFRLRGDSKTR
jgi:hypothetical protein